MRPIHRYGREIDSIFDLLGRDENSLTFALGWCLSRVPLLLDEVAAILGKPAPGQELTIHLQDHKGEDGITDIEVRELGRVAWIFEAKTGFEPPTHAQLAKYARSLLAGTAEGEDRLLVVLARSDRRDLWLRLNVPQEVGGVAVRVLSWGQVALCAERAYQATDNTGKALLRQFRGFLGMAVRTRAIDSNLAYVVSVNRDRFSEGATTFLDVVERHRKYFHPVGKGWPRDPPNYMAFRWDGRMQSIHHVDSYQVITSWLPHFPDAGEEEVGPLFLYDLGPPIVPSREVRTGALYRSTRVSAAIDLLLTSGTISEAWALTKQRGQSVE